MEKLRKYIQSHSLLELLQEHAWLSRHSLRYKKEVLWYIFVGLLGTAMSLAGSITTHRPSVLEVSNRVYRIRHDRIQIVK